MGLALVCLVALALGSLPAFAQGVGISPTAAEFDDTLRNGEYYRTITVINGGSSDQVFSFQPGGDIGQWLTIVDTEDRTQVLETITAGANSRARVLLRLNIPEDAPNGTFRGVVRVMAAGSGSTQGNGAGASVNIGAEILVQAIVSGTQVIDGKLIDASVNQVELGSFMRINSVVQNLGNVRVNPQVTLEVLNPEGTVVFQETFQQESIFASETGALTAEWDTTGQELGDYRVKTSVRFGDFDVGEREFDFTILPFGTLTRQGELRSLELVVKPDPQDLGMMHAIFQNTGQIDTLAKFIGEFYFGDRLIDVLTSEEVLVLVGEQKRLEVFPRAGEAGEYSIRGKVNFEGKESEVLRLNFLVAAAAVSSNGEATEEPTTPSAGSSTPETAATPGGAATPESTTSSTATTSATDDGGVAAWLWIVIIAAIAALVAIIFVKRKSIPGLKPSE